MNFKTWKALAIRLEKEVKNENLTENRQIHKYRKSKENKGIKFSPSNDNSFCGILNHLRTKSNGRIENEVGITASSIYDNSDNHQPRNAVCYENNNYQENNWLCFDFKEHRVIPTDYTIKTYNCLPNYRNLKSWAVEISSDKENWEVIDEENDCPYMNGCFLTHTFHIKKPPSKESRYIRIKSTGPCWNGEYYFNIGKIEIYGTLI